MQRLGRVLASLDSKGRLPLRFMPPPVPSEELVFRMDGSAAAAAGEDAEADDTSEAARAWELLQKSAPGRLYLEQIDEWRHLREADIIKAPTGLNIFRRFMPRAGAEPEAIQVMRAGLRRCLAGSIFSATCSSTNYNI